MTANAPTTLEDALKARQAAAAKVHDGVPGAQTEWDRADAVLQSFDKSKTITADAAIHNAELARQEAARVRHAKLESLGKTFFEEAKPNLENVAKGCDAKITAVGSAHGEIRQAHEALHNRAREIIGFAAKPEHRLLKSNASAENVTNAFRACLESSGVPITGGLMDPSLPSVQAVALNEIASLEHEVRKFLLSEGISL